MNIETVQKIKKQTVEFVSNPHNWSNPVALTLTLKQRRFFRNELGGHWQDLTPYEVERTISHFTNRINKKVFGNAALRYGRKCNFAGAIEKSPSGRLHYHATIDCPPHIDPLEFKIQLHECWSHCTDWGDKQIDIQFGADRDWIGYSLKLKGKVDFCGYIDWENMHLKCI